MSLPNWAVGKAPLSIGDLIKLKPVDKLDPDTIPELLDELSSLEEVLQKLCQ